MRYDYRSQVHRLFINDIPIALQIEQRWNDASLYHAALRGQLRRDYYLRNFLGTIPLRDGVYHLPDAKYPQPWCRFRRIT